MVVITLEKCPLSLRGDLTRWLQEISRGVYVGQISARVRENLWSRICEECKNGQATMVYSARNEQHYDFRVHNSRWMPIDFDGVKLMMRPNPATGKRARDATKGYSNASIRRKARTRGNSGVSLEPSDYVSFDFETTGLNPKSNEIIEIGAVRVINGREFRAFRCVVKPDKPVPKEISALTGITPADLSNGLSLDQAINDFISFIGNSTLVAHNAEFDSAFLREALVKLDLEDVDNEIIDTLQLAKKRYPHLKSYRLCDLADYLSIEVEASHSALSDARAACRLLQELNE